MQPWTDLLINFFSEFTNLVLAIIAVVISAPIAVLVLIALVLIYRNISRRASERAAQGKLGFFIQISWLFWVTALGIGFILLVVLCRMSLGPAGNFAIDFLVDVKEADIDTSRLYDSTLPQPAPTPIPQPTPDPNVGGGAPSSGDAPPPAPPAAGTTTYTVVRGDTFGRIATAHGLDIAGLRALNPQVADPNRIFPGDVLNVPVR